MRCDACNDARHVHLVVTNNTSLLAVTWPVEYCLLCGAVSLEIPARGPRMMCSVLCLQSANLSYMFAYVSPLVNVDLASFYQLQRGVIGSRVPAYRVCHGSHKQRRPPCIFHSKCRAGLTQLPGLWGASDRLSAVPAPLDTSYRSRCVTDSVNVWY